MKNIVVAIFDVESEGYEAFAKLRQMADEKSYSIYQMALVKRENDTVKVCDAFDSGLNTVDNTIKGGLIGGLVGILGGPIGVLLMGTYGAAVGSFVDAGDVIDGASMIEMVVGKLGDGTTALVLLADEANESVMDAYLKDDYKVEILRYDAAAIEEEVKQAAMMEAEMARQTRMNLRKGIRAEIKQNAKERRSRIEEDLEEVREKMAEYNGDPMIE